MLMLDWGLSSRGLVSEVLLALFDCAAKFDLKALSKLSFAQVLSNLAFSNLCPLARLALSDV